MANGSGLVQTPWADVYKEMVIEKGLETEVADRLEQYLLGDAATLAALQADDALAAQPAAKVRFLGLARARLTLWGLD